MIDSIKVPLGTVKKQKKKQQMGETDEPHKKRGKEKVLRRKSYNKLVRISLYL